MTAEIRLRQAIADLSVDIGKIVEVLPIVSDDADRSYLEREVDRIQGAAHRLIAFLDTGILDTPRQ